MGKEDAFVKAGMWCPGCRHEVRCAGMVRVGNCLAHRLFTSHGMSSTLCPVFESRPSSTLTQLLRSPGVKMQMVWRTLPMSFLDDKYFINVFSFLRGTDSSRIRGQGSFIMGKQKILHVFTASSPKRINSSGISVFTGVSFQKGK